MKIFVVYDSKAKVHLLPAFIHHSADALRGFEAASNNPEHAFGKHPADYTLFEIANYNEEKAEFDVHKAKINLGTALEYVNIDENERSASIMAVNEELRIQLQTQADTIKQLTANLKAEFE